MDKINIEQAKLNMKNLETLTKEKEELEKNNPYLPQKYDAEILNRTMDQIDAEIDKLNEIKKKIETMNQKGKTLEEEDIFKELDEIILAIEQLTIKRENFEKYKKLNEKIESTIINSVLSISESRGDVFKELFDDSLEKNVTISSFVNRECLRNEKIKKPFMVALLTMDPEMIYEEIANKAYDLTPKQKKDILDYIKFQKDRINRNLILSDKTLISLLETTTGKNIMEQEHINSKNKYENYCDYLSYEIYGRSIKEQLLISSPEEVYNGFNNSKTFINLSNIDKRRIDQHLKYLKNQLIREHKKIEYSVAKYQSDTGKYAEQKEKTNIYHSLDGKIIKRFSSNGIEQFTRTIDDMRIANFPIEDVEDYIFECFSSNKVSQERKQQLIAVALDNLELCYDLFNSYYKSSDMELTSYLNMSNGDQIKLDYKLNEENMPHILGIPKTHKFDTKGNIIGRNLPIETIKTLDLNENKYYSAIDILETILKKKENIINSLGCYTKNGILYEMLPWEKIILKTNAFIRGDFFKTTSLITGINPDSFLTGPGENINAVSLNSTYFGRSAINQQIPNIQQTSPLIKGGNFKLGRNSLLEKHKDLILKGLIAQFKDDKIRRIKGVVTNESFIGERLNRTNGIPIKTMNKPSYLLENINENSTGIVTSVENPLGFKEYSIDEMILLLEDMALTFDDNPKFIDIATKTIEEIETLSNKKNKHNKH